MAQRMMEVKRQDSANQLILLSTANSGDSKAIQSLMDSLTGDTKDRSADGSDIEKLLNKGF